jgi:predicted dehydrogenase
VKELIMSGVIGDVKQIHFEWLLDTSHGADYFRRWHRDKRNSGGLMVHKATHHFDLVNFWLDSYPVKVFALGDLKFYGRENAEERGITKFYYRSTNCENAKGDPFGANISVGGNKDLYYDCEKDDGYLRDQSVFGDGISIEDTMNLVVKYANGAQMSYSLNAFSPWEGYRIMFTGTKGRLELEVVEAVVKNLGVEHGKNSSYKDKRITVYPMFKAPYEVEIPDCSGGHGGGDPVMLNEIFNPNPPEDPFKRAAGYLDGCMSILTGIAANKSMATGMPVDVKDLVDIPGFKF